MFCELGCKLLGHFPILSVAFTTGLFVLAILQISLIGTWWFFFSVSIDVEWRFEDLEMFSYADVCLLMVHQMLYPCRRSDSCFF